MAGFVPAIPIKDAPRVSRRSAPLGFGRAERTDAPPSGGLPRGAGRLLPPRTNLLISQELSEWNLRLEHEGHVLCYEFDSHAERTGIASLMRRMSDLGIAYKDLSTHQSSLEDIFVELVHKPRNAA